MKHLLLTCLILPFAAAAEEKPTPPVQSENHNELIMRWIKDFAIIQPGMTRAELDRKFNHDGGISTPSQLTYIHPECRHAKIQITFQNTLHDADGRPIALLTDKVLSTSQPFLQIFTSD